MKRCSNRGSSLVEVLFASAVLLIGLAGIFQLILLAMGQYRNSDVKEASQQVVASTLAAYQSMSYEELQTVGAGTFALPDYVDSVGRSYAREVTTTEFGGVADGGLGSFQVDIVVSWQQRAGALTVGQTSTGTVLVSEVPDDVF